MDINEIIKREIWNSEGISYDEDILNDLDGKDSRDGGYAGWALPPDSDLNGYNNASNNILEMETVTPNMLQNSVTYIRNFNLNKIDDLVSKEDINALLNSYTLIVQNIDNTLSLVDDDVKFFNRLMDIQTYLKSMGIINEDLVYFNTDDATQDEFSIGEEEISEDLSQRTGLDNRRVEEIAQKVAQKLGYTTPKLLDKGTKGYWGAAFDLGNKVLKLTADKSEAVESLKMKGQQHKHIAYIYNVYVVETPQENDDYDVYAIVLEKLDKPKLDSVYERADQYFRNTSKESLFSIIYFYESMGFKFMPQAVDALNSAPADIKDFVNQYMELIKEVGQVGLLTADYFKGNLGYRGNTLVFFDLGGSPDERFIGNQPEKLKMEQIDTMVERVMTWMPKAKSVKVKKKCQLGGNGDGTSVACDQGDISNLEISEINDDNAHRRKANVVNIAEETVPFKGKIKQLEENKKKTINENDWQLNQVLKGAEEKNIDVRDIDGNKYLVLWHGTIPSLHKKILNTGKYLAGTYFAPDKETARTYGKMKMSRGEPVVSVSLINANNIHYDGNYFVAKTDIHYKGNSIYENIVTSNKSLISENKVEYGCLMLYFDIPEWNTLLSKINPEDLYEDGSGTFGTEIEPHITILYGFHPEVTAEDFEKISKQYDGDFKLFGTSLSLFENPKFDVIKIDIEPSEELLKLRKDVENLPNTLTYTDYHPHMTVAYVKSGEGKKYAKDFNGKKIKFTGSKLVYSDKNRNKTEFNKKKELVENNVSDECIKLEIPLDVQNFLKKYKSDEDLLRNGGLSNDLLDKWAFGFTENMNQIMPDQLLIRWKDDLENVKHEIRHKGQSDLDYANSVDLSEPIEVDYWEDVREGFKEGFYIQDGHHRYYAAKILNKPLNMVLTIKVNPIAKISAMDYDQFHRCIWKQVNGLTENTINNKTLTVYHGTKQKFVNDIKQNGLVDNTGYNQGWYMVSTDFESALFHAHPDEQNGDVYVFEFSVPLEENSKWEGYPYLWKGQVMNDNSTWYALKEKLPSDFIKNTHRVGYTEWEKQKNRGFKKESVTQESNNTYKNHMIKEADIMQLQDLPFKQEIERMGGKIYSVGGAVRDEFLGKESKDLDILITGIPMDQLEAFLKKYGKVDAVGKSFGILKFKPHGAVEDIDVAIPRTEVATGIGGHQGFDVKSDHNLSIEDDLKRRDFTINAIAKDMDGNLIDPFGGQSDLQKKIIRVVNPEAFSDDPLRMIRAVQFAARFEFSIDDQTMKMIQANASRIKEIAGERILEEFKKVVSKGGDPLYAADLLRETGLYKEIFGTDSPQTSADHWDSEAWNNIRTLGEFMFMLMSPVSQQPEEIFKTRLKGDIQSIKEIAALSYAWKQIPNNVFMGRALAHNIWRMYPNIFESKILPKEYAEPINDLKMGRYPKGLGDLAVNGNDLMSLGLQGKQIGDTLSSLLIFVYGDKVKNVKEDLINKIKNG